MAEPIELPAIVSLSRASIGRGCGTLPPIWFYITHDDEESARNWLRTLDGSSPTVGVEKRTGSQCLPKDPFDVDDGRMIRDIVAQSLESVSELQIGPSGVSDVLPTAGLRG
ncbi:MAG: hypothetical protein U1A27_05610 [Phycisphaerae bacterium]